MKSLGWALAPCLVLLLGMKAPSGPPSPVRPPIPAPNYCELYGYSGKPANVMSCTNLPRGRTITCMAGYAAAPSPTTASITLAGSTAFHGCQQINMCTLYGYSGHPDHALACTTGPNVRTITCASGYVASPPDGKSITLTGAAPFKGCSTARQRPPGR